jgi:hypothetical protein
VGRRSFIVVPITLKNILLPTMREYSYSKNCLLENGLRDAGKDLSNIE